MPRRDRLALSEVDFPTLAVRGPFPTIASEGGRGFEVPHADSFVIVGRDDEALSPTKDDEEDDHQAFNDDFSGPKARAGCYAGAHPMKFVIVRRDDEALSPVKDDEVDPSMRRQNTVHLWMVVMGSRKNTIFQRWRRRIAIFVNPTKGGHPSYLAMRAIS